MAYRLRNSVIRDPKGRIKFRRLSASGGEHYHIGVWLEADTETEMDRVTRVEYLLHPTFPNPNRSSANRKNDFSITFWAWGAFEIVATVHLADGETEQVRHRMDISLPADTGENYIDVT